MWRFLSTTFVLCSFTLRSTSSSNFFLCRSIISGLHFYTLKRKSGLSALKRTSFLSWVFICAKNIWKEGHKQCHIVAFWLRCSSDMWLAVSNQETVGLEGYLPTRHCGEHLMSRAHTVMTETLLSRNFWQLGIERARPSSCAEFKECVTTRMQLRSVHYNSLKLHGA